MSDRTPLQLRIVHCPPNRVRPILDVIEEYDLHPDPADQAGLDENHLGFNVLYLGLEVRCGSAAETAKTLQSIAPDASWEVWEDPKFEWLGDLYRFTPKLGVWTSECDNSGDAVFKAGEITALLEDRSLSRDDLDTKLGLVHTAALDAVRDTYGTLVLSADRTRPDSDEEV